MSYTEGFAERRRRRTPSKHTINTPTTADAEPLGQAVGSKQAHLEGVSPEQVLVEGQSTLGHVVVLILTLNLRVQRERERNERDGQNART
jgi:hypothetical protein